MRIIGHRGARQEAPENTLGGFQHLQELGIRGVEFDIRQLQDEELVVIHDDNFLRTAGLDQIVEQSTLAQALSVDHRKNWPNWPSSEPTPTLKQVLTLLDNFDHIEVEVKAVRDMALAERLVQKLEAELQGYEKVVTITSFDLQILSALQQNKSQFKRGLLIELPVGATAIEFAHQYGCVHIGWHDQLATDEVVRLSQQANLNISVWTVNDIERAKSLRDLGVQGLITDIPTAMLQAL
ncbi:glycerophosphodiester phosphodiesterase [Acinetobacter calcoaceticus]|uniref:glycerophosphodiester phosphodiesterase n=1 Tax=Acinetobacter calcoaceticus TaxID=471 RepID=UPI0019015C06|nr:glycerophosphodiester phosphodiesterase [Acinetobacter calcoaceticus]MBJ9722643.1 glycerophosphodiester phosphodiesterase [Acinetobacter calcoaceticus]